MGLFDSILSAVTGRSDSSAEANPLIGILGGLLAQSGGLQGLANKFSQSGVGGVFSSWVGLEENQPISSDQIQKVLGSEEVKALAAKIGVDSSQVSHFYPNTYRRLWTSLRQRERSIPMRITSRVWLICYPRSCKVSARNLPVAVPNKRSGWRSIRRRFRNGCDRLSVFHPR